MRTMSNDNTVAEVVPLTEAELTDLYRRADEYGDGSLSDVDIERLLVTALSARADLDCATRFRIGDLSVFRYADGWQIRRGWEQWGPFTDRATAIAEARRMGAEEKEKRDVHL